MGHTTEETNELLRLGQLEQQLRDKYNGHLLWLAHNVNDEDWLRVAGETNQLSADLHSTHEQLINLRACRPRLGYSPELEFETTLNQLKNRHGS